VRRELERQGLGQADDAAFGRGVMHADAVAAAARRDGGEVDDAAELARLHARSKLPAHQERGGEIRRKNLAPLRFAHVFELQAALTELWQRLLTAGRDRAAGDVDQKIRRAGFRRESLYVVGVGQVGHGDALPGMDVRGNDLHAFLLQPLGNGSADPAGCARDQRLASLQPLKRHTKRR
jgi:hypothetical protein